MRPLRSRRAMEADSTFWFAYWRYAYARRWWSEPVDSVVYARIEEHLGGFPEKERLVAGAWLTRGQSARLTKRREVVARFPDYWPAWFELGEQLSHHGGYLGVAHSETQNALERTVALHPRLVPGWEHLSWIVVMQRDLPAARRALEALARLRVGGDPPELAYLGYLVALVERAGEPDPRIADAGARLMARMGDVPPEALSFSLSLYGFPRAQVDLADRVLALEAPPALHAEMWRGKAGAWAGRGAWDSALVAAERYATARGGPEAALPGYRLAVAGAWLGAVELEAPSRWRSLVTRSTLPLEAETRAEVAWLDGILGATRRDRAAVARAQAELRATADPHLSFLDRSLAAFDRELRGDRRLAADSLAALERESAEEAGHYGYGPNHPFLNAIHRLTAARWLVAEGDTLEAAHLLRFHEAIFPPRLRALTWANQILAGPAYRERARIEEGAGRAADTGGSSWSVTTPRWRVCDRGSRRRPPRGPLSPAGAAA